jgi:hypothetical protein
MPYATVAELRSYVGIPAGDTTDDTLLTLALDASTEAIDAYAGRKFTADAAAVTRYYTAISSDLVRIDGIQTTTDLAVAVDDDGDGTYETTLTRDTDYRLEPPNAPADGRPWTGLAAFGTRRFPTRSRAGRVTARFGWTTVPAAVKQACLLQASRLFKRKDAPFGIAGSLEMGSEMRLLAALDPDVQAVLQPFRVGWWVVVT